MVFADLSSVLSDLLVPRRYPWYLLTIGFLMGLLGLPLAYGLLRKRAVALALVYAMLGLTLLLVAIRIPVAIKHFADTSEKLSASFDIELLFKNTSVGMFAALV